MEFELAAQTRKQLYDVNSEWMGDKVWDDVRSKIIALVSAEAE